MKAPLLKLLGVLHGVFGLAAVVALPFAYASGLVTQYKTAYLAISAVAILISAYFLLVCAWKAWHLSPHAHIFAWRALAMYLLPGFFTNDPAWYMHVMPVFYYSVAVRALAALALWALARPTTASSGNG